ncbi:hypothetical protein PS880_01505 [Pseudomonas fluorescens]|uniref:Uncharacterized protein n=1 Tax=Pseudomonas fluorescens TaxID=294 RepID=A0A5E7IUZ6_PSEFL|nr:hypothetical protein PS880_01505 [Pseudomonas fluorescens]
MISPAEAMTNGTISAGSSLITSRDLSLRLQLPCCAKVRTNTPAATIR